MMAVDPFAQSRFVVRSLWSGALMNTPNADRGVAEGFQSDCDRQGIACVVVELEPMPPVSPTPSTLVNG